MPRYPYLRRLAQAALVLACLPRPASAAAAEASADTATSVEVSSPAQPELQAVEAQPVLAPAEREPDPLSLPDLEAGGFPVLEFELPGARIGLEECLRRALTGNPRLAAWQQEVWAAQARCLQAGLKPNPELEAEISDFMGTAETRFFRGAVTGVGLSQLIERGRKRCARIAVAVEEGDLAQLEIERARLDIMLEVSSAYYAVLAAQERLKVAAQLEQLAEQVRAVVALKVEAGKAARLELSRVDIDLASADIAREQAQQELRRACVALSLLWAEPTPQFEAVEGELRLPAAPPLEEELRELLAASPDIARWDREAGLRKALRELAYADGIPDYTLSGGLERFEATDSFGFRIGISMPLPIRDRNQGSVVEAQRYLDQTADLKAVELRKAQRSLADLVSQMRIAYERAQALRQQVLPPAEETFELTSYGYRYGKFGVLEVLDSERTLIEARSQYVEALAEYYLAGAQLERLIAQPPDLSEIETVPGDPELRIAEETAGGPVTHEGQEDSDE